MLQWHLHYSTNLKVKNDGPDEAEYNGWLAISNICHVDID